MNLKKSKNYTELTKKYIKEKKIIKLNLYKCKYAKQGKQVKGCTGCGYWIECGNKKVVADRVKSGVCQKCEYFEVEGV